MRQRWLIVFLAAIASLALLAAACGGDSGPAAPNSDNSGSETSDQPSGDEPASSGFVAPNVFMTFEGQRYELGDVFQSDLISDEFTEIGVASAADIDFEGELKVFGRSGDDAAVYTFSPALDVEGEEEDVPALWLRWELVVEALGEEPSGDGEPTSSGVVVPDTFLTFDGQRYQLREVLQANLISDDFTEVGAASEADIDFDGELTVFRRQGDDAAVYTYSPAVDIGSDVLALDEGDEVDVLALWEKWEPVD